MDQCNCSTASSGYYRCLALCRAPELSTRPLPFIGVYIAMANLVCFLVVIADLWHGLLHNKPWIPSKYFSMNAATLTVLAVGVKLPLDITTKMLSDTGYEAKLCSIFVMTAAMATFTPSLASMNKRDVWQNMVALGILVITLSVNCVIQMFTYMVDPLSYGLALILFFAQFMFMISSALSAPATKSYLELRYRKLEEHIPSVRLDSEKERFCVKSLRKHIQFYWMMAKTGSPVFVMARSITCFTTSLMSSFIPLNIIITFLTYDLSCHQLVRKGDTDYRWSIPVIQVTQLLLNFGCLATLFLRSKFIISSFSKKICISHFKHVCKIEEYWTKGLKQLKHRPLGCHIENRTCRKIIEDVKIVGLNMCIAMQVIIVLLSKLTIVLIYLVLRPVYFCFHHLRILVCSSSNQNKSELDSGTATELAELQGYVLLLEGELELPLSIIKGICNALDQVIQMGAKQHKGTLLELVSGKVLRLNSLLEFDNEEVESLHAEEPPRCWSLSIANLTSICVALSTIESDEKRKLLQSVDEGMFYIRSIEKNLDSKKKLENVGKAANLVWNGVELKSEWLEKDIRPKTVQGKKAKEILQRLAKISKDIVMGFKSNTRFGLLENPRCWPKKVIAANSMYRLSQTLLLQCDSGSLQSDEQVFHKVINLIADIFIVGLTNLPLAISTMCYTATIEKREKSVREAAHLFGATENILQFLSQQSGIPILPDGDGAPYIDEWRAFIKEQNAISSTLSNNNSRVSDRLIRSKSI